MVQDLSEKVDRLVSRLEGQHLAETQPAAESAHILPTNVEIQPDGCEKTLEPDDAAKYPHCQSRRQDSPAALEHVSGKAAAAAGGEDPHIRNDRQV